MDEINLDIQLKEMNFSKGLFSKLSHQKYNYRKLGDFIEKSAEDICYDFGPLNADEVLIKLKSYGVILKNYNVKYVQKYIKCGRVPAICDVEILNQLPVRYFRKNSGKLICIKQCFQKYYETLLKIRMREREGSITELKEIEDNIYEVAEKELLDLLERYVEIMNEKIRLATIEQQNEQEKQPSIYSTALEHALRAKRNESKIKMYNILNEEQKRYHHKPFDEMEL